MRVSACVSAGGVQAHPRGVGLLQRQGRRWHSRVFRLTGGALLVDLDTDSAKLLLLQLSTICCAAQVPCWLYSGVDETLTYCCVLCAACVLQFGHLFAQGPTREAACRAMVVALRDVRVRGEIHTIIDYAADMLQVNTVEASTLELVAGLNCVRES